MGCFDVVCALTNTPIKTGEKCYLCIFPKDVDFTYGVTWVANGEARWGGQLTVLHGEYDDYGSVDVTGKLTPKMGELLENFREDDTLHFFICEEAWKWAQGKYKDFVPQYVLQRREMRDLARECAKVDKKKGVTANKRNTSALKEIAGEATEDEDFIEIGRVMMAFAQCCKHPLSGLGCYHQYDGSELESIRELNAMQDKRLKRLEEEKARLDEEFHD
jgi:hypothetical protein